MLSASDFSFFIKASTLLLFVAAQNFPLLKPQGSQKPLFPVFLLCVLLNVFWQLWLVQVSEAVLE